MKTTEQITKEVVQAINEDPSELYEFVEFVKTYGIALKLAFRCDRAIAWELVRLFLREFEKIGMYRRQYDQRVDEVAYKLKGCSTGDPIQARLENIVAEAAQLKKEFEKDYAATLKRIKRKRKAK